MAEAANKGAPWCMEQDAWLWENIPKFSKDKLACVMQRTVAGIQGRLTHIAAQKVSSDQLGLQEAAAYAQIPADWIGKKLATVATTKTNFYAVQNGKEGNKIYSTWEECKANASGRYGSYKKFTNAEEAQAFLASGNQQQKVAKEKEGESTKSNANLNDEQKAAYDAVRHGQSIFLCGSAGVGKSYTLRCIMEWGLKRGLHIQQTAMTGTAALLVNGRTLHSFLGIGLGRGLPVDMAERTQEKNKSLTRQLGRLQILLVDEVSMLDAELCDKISAYLSILRNDTRPFGGVQMVFSGDLAQLPAVNGKFAFHANAWKELAPNKCILKTLVRQAGDPVFQNMLERLRFGICEPHDFERLLECKKTQFPEGIQPTRLYALNKDVDRINSEEFEKLRGTVQVTRTYMPKFACPGSKRWAEACGTGNGIELCVGAQVVVTRNMENGCVNGSRGVVSALNENTVQIKLLSGALTEVPFVAIENDDGSLKIAVMPLKLAYALTCHKSQGMTMDAIELDLGPSIFECGQAYTALSRARSLASVKITAVVPRAFKCHPDVVAFYE